MRRCFERKGPDSKVASSLKLSPLEHHQHSDHVKHRHSLLSEYFSTFCLKVFSSGTNLKRVAIIGFGNIGLYIAYFFLKKGYSVCVCELDSDPTNILQIMEAELPYMLNSFMFGKHLQRYSAADIRAMLARFSVASDLNDLVSKGNKVYFECISKDLEGKQQLFADLTELLHQRRVPAWDVVLCTCTQDLSLRSISLGALPQYKSRLIGLNLSCGAFKVKYQGAQQRRIAAIRTLADAMEPN
jgi:hypothetical protein